MTKRISRPVRLQLAAAAAAGLWFLLTPTPAQVQTVSAVRIAVVEYGRLLEQSVQGKAAIERLRVEFEPRGIALEAMQRELNTLTTKAQNEGPTMSAAELTALNNQIRDKSAVFQSTYEAYARAHQEREAQELNQLGEQIRLTVATYAFANSLDIVIADQPMLYITQNPAINITNAILAIMTPRP